MDKYEYEGEFDPYYSMLEDEKAILEETLKKPTEDICKIVLSESFFNTIKNVKEVYFLISHSELLI